MSDNDDTAKVRAKLKATLQRMRKRKPAASKLLGSMLSSALEPMAPELEEKLLETAGGILESDAASPDLKNFAEGALIGFAAGAAGAELARVAAAEAKGR